MSMPTSAGGSPTANRQVSLSSLLSEPDDSLRRPPPLSPLAVTVNGFRDAGGWVGVFGRHAPLELEIGFGWDPFLCDEASRRPETDFVGIEYDGKRVEHFVRRAEKRGLANVRAVFGDAFHLIPRLFAHRELSRVYIHFPDPWHKKRQQKNRLLGPHFLELLFYHVTPGGELVAGTDSADYKDFIHESLSAVGGVVNLNAPAPWADRLPGHPETRFERLFRQQGKPIHYFHYRREASFDDRHVAAVEALRAQVPGRMNAMPHAVFDRALDLAAWALAFKPFSWTEAGTLYKVTEVWTPVAGTGLLLEGVMVREGHDALFYVELRLKAGRSVLRVSPVREVERDELLFRFLAGLARRLLEFFPGARLERHNLGKYIEGKDKGT
ncbi:MAG: tRNA (guanosine(46)-N7)-methyltransferase TrmB [Acidobacteria bacterium]|nr:tRNA (guanosine(46)-N7)-methyltransferase TrmB [Acidobacteriota bacterium]